MDYAPDLSHDFAVTVGGLAGALTASLVGGVVNAWLFLLKVPAKAAPPGPPVP